MTIRNKAKFDANPPAGFDGVFEWDYLIPAFQVATGRNIQPMDNDCDVEINGHHLMFETKEEKAPVQWGQLKCLHSHWERGHITIIILWGKREPLECWIWYPKGSEKEDYWAKTVTKKQLRNFCEQWASKAQEKPAHCTDTARLSARTKFLEERQDRFAAARAIANGPEAVKNFVTGADQC